MFGALGLVGNCGQAIGMLAAGALTGPLGLMALLDGQGALYLLAGALAAVGLARAALPGASRERPGGTYPAAQGSPWGGHTVHSHEHDQAGLRGPPIAAEHRRDL